MWLTIVAYKHCDRINGADDSAPIGCLKPSLVLGFFYAVRQNCTVQPRSLARPRCSLKMLPPLGGSSEGVLLKKAGVPMRWALITFTHYTGNDAMFENFSAEDYAVIEADSLADALAQVSMPGESLAQIDDSDSPYGGVFTSRRVARRYMNSPAA